MGAFVDCFVAAPDHLSALVLTSEELHKRGCAIEKLVDGKVHQLDPQQWHAYVLSTWPELPGHFPSQADVLRIVAVDGLFFGPFLAWEQEK